jgi:4-hydroxybenzoate polyprenyltransferase
MGACRFLNVLLGLSVGGPLTERPWTFHLALVVGLYIVGVTWFARTEARMSSQKALASAATVMLLGLLLALALPARFSEGTVWALYPYLLVAFGFYLGIPVCTAIATPTPAHVQTAVKRAIFGLVMLDAILATAFQGLVGLLILLLLIPAMYLGRWLYST